MATKFSPCKGSYVLNQFPSNVMFGMNGFHLSASGAIQGHHGPLVDNVGQDTHNYEYVLTKCDFPNLAHLFINIRTFFHYSMLYKLKWSFSRQKAQLVHINLFFVAFTKHL